MKRAIMILATAALASTLAIGAAEAHGGGGGGGHGGFGGGGFGGGHMGFGGGARISAAWRMREALAANISDSAVMPAPAALACASMRSTALVAIDPDTEFTAPIQIATIGTSCTPTNRCR